MTTEIESTQQELELMAAKQLLMELLNLKQYIYSKNMVITGMLIVQLRFVINGLMSKYNKAGMLIGQHVNVKVIDKKSKHASIAFEYSPELQSLMKQVVSLQEVNK